MERKGRSKRRKPQSRSPPAVVLPSSRTKGDKGEGLSARSRGAEGEEKMRRAPGGEEWGIHALKLLPWPGGLAVRAAHASLSR